MTLTKPAKRCLIALCCLLLDLGLMKLLLLVQWNPNEDTLLLIGIVYVSMIIIPVIVFGLYSTLLCYQIIVWRSVSKALFEEGK